MPIYEYRCTACGFQNDYLQKISDPQLTDCPECGKSTFAKQVTAAGFQLKGTGWYATDFKNKGTPKAGSGEGAKTESSKGDGGKSSDGGKVDAGAKSDPAPSSSGGSSDAAACGAGASPACT